MCARRISVVRATFLASILLAMAGASPAFAQRHVTTPAEYFGFDMGQDYHLANYQQMVGYWTQLDKESQRVKVVPIGTTAEGRTMVMGIVTSPANHRKLEKYQQTARRLARADGVVEREAQRLTQEGKAIVWIDGGLHSSETLGSQQLIETLFRLVNGKDPETLRILDDVIVLFVPANPDGIELVGNWYMREKEPSKRSLTGLPRLYHKYIGHDDNRDFYASTQPETKAMNRIMYREWFPQIVYNHHQSGPPGTVLFCPPFRDPFNYNVDPMVINGIDMVGAAMMNRFLAEGKPGATTRSGSRYSTWWNGGLRTTCYFHNMIGLLTETIGSPNPGQIPFDPRLQLPRADLLSPIAPQPWHLRQSVEYSVTANYAVLDFASKNRSALLNNIYLMGRRAITRGGGDSWTTTPRRVAEAQEGRGGGSSGRGAGEFQRLFRAPGMRDARAYIIPADQPDLPTATRFINTLIETGVTVHRATADFSAAGKNHPAHIVDLFEPQDHPNDFQYPGGPPIPPYDITGWTLAWQMGVHFDRVTDTVDGMFEELNDVVGPPPGRVARGGGDLSGFAFSCRVNNAFRAANRLLKAGESVWRLTSNVRDRAGNLFENGDFFVAATPGTMSQIDSLARETGVSFKGTDVLPSAGMEAMSRPRIGLWDRYGGSMPSGWTRWILEQFEFPFEVVYAPDLDAGKLRDRFDVLILVDGAVPARTGGTAARGATRAPESGGDQPPGERAPAAGERVPAEYRNRVGSVSASRTIPQLRQFAEAGGTIVAIGGSTSLAAHLGLPLGNQLVEPGKTQPLPRDKFYIPGSIVRARVDAGHPLAQGMDPDVDMMFVNSPVFRWDSKAPQGGIEIVAWFDSAAPLRSGWAWGQQHLEDGLAVLNARVGQGNLVLCGPEVFFRGQPHGTFKFVFNAIHRARLSMAPAGL
jgi:hypothetical protein